MTAQWRQNRRNNRWGTSFFYLAVRFGGRRPAYFFLYFVVFAYAFFFPSVKKQCAPYLLKRFPCAGSLNLGWHRYLLILNLGKILVDAAVLGILGDKKLSAEFSSQGDFHAIRSLDSGFILLMSHVGCWQVAMATLSRLNRPVNLVMLPGENNLPGANEKFNIINPDQFLGGTLDMLAALKRDEIVCIMGDRVLDSSGPSLEAVFFNTPARFPLSPYRLASTSGKPVVVLNTYKSGPSDYKLSLPAIIHVPPRLGKKGAAYQHYVNTYVKTLSDYAEAHPYQFFNFYDMWHSRVTQPKKADTP
ncbi:MAG: lysophospholipid acyltransferase family protein [Desulfobacterales bacterium]|nr:lysophospholipid acyltransferase family protein [Desulfobacterales bacterium]